MSDTPTELDVILERYRLHADVAYSEVEDNFHTAEEFKILALPNVLDEAKQALLDWHNKQIDKILANDFFKYCQGCSCDAADLLKSERNKLKEVMSERD